MRIPEVHLRRRLYSAGMKSKAMTRIRHFRGHGVHSPFVYSLIRNILMKRRTASAAHDLYDELRRRGVGRHWAVQLQNIFTELHYDTFRFAAAGDGRCAITDGEMYLIGPGTACETIAPMVGNMSALKHSVVCILSPTASKDRLRAVAETIRSHNGTSIDNRNYVLLFYDEGLPKQHFKL